MKANLGMSEQGISEKHLSLISLCAAQLSFGLIDDGRGVNQTDVSMNLTNSARV
uniref:Uncharacterized protein n=1 Tax=Setaria digitata TaxID=48799 RepID=A0A915PIU2_9BILA